MNEEYPDTASMSLFSNQGERKYLNSRERRRFYKALSVLTELSERTFCETIFWTGCRPSEALQLDYMRVDVQAACLVFRTLKKRGDNKAKHFRVVPIPKRFAKLLDDVHGIVKCQRRGGANLLKRIWTFGRQTGWRLMNNVMKAAKIFGVRATARGLRHSFGIHAILSRVPETRLQSWMGHASLKTTAIYVQAAGAEDRAFAKLMWKREAYAAYA
ncbi:MAG: site-specific integrase [Pseudomonadota bacterium]